MKKLYFLITLFVINQLNAQIINFPDYNFKSKLVTSTATNSIAKDNVGNFMKVDANSDGQITVSEVINVYEITNGGGLLNPISDFTGIGYFQNLKSFFVSNGPNNFYNIPNLDFTGLTNLESLYIAGATIQNLTVNGLSNLKYLNCSYNQIQNLNLTGLSGLETLNCANNDLSILNVSGLTSLTELRCNDNLLTNLDVTTLQLLDYFTCENNQLVSLNVNNLITLRVFFCDNNQLSTLSLNGLTGLQSIYCNDNLLTNLDFTTCINLNYIRCYSNDLTNLNVMGLSNLISLDCGTNNLESLNVTGLNMLQGLYCNSNQIVDLDVSSLSNLYALDCRNNLLTTLDVNGLTNLYILGFDNNPNITNVFINDIAYNGVSGDLLSFSNNPNLTFICTNENKISLVQSIVNGYGYDNCVVDASCSLITNNFEMENVFTIYPNPTNSILNIKSNQTTDIISINIYNTLGQLILEFPFSKNLDSINISSLAANNYFIKIISDKIIKTIKFLKI